MSDNGQSYEDWMGLGKSPPPRSTIETNHRARGSWPGEHAPEPPADEQEESGYQAFGISREGPATMLDVRQADGTGDLFPLHLLMRVTYTQDRFVSLTFPDCIVTLEGEHLDELVKALHARRVDFVTICRSGYQPISLKTPIIRAMEIASI